MVAPDWSVVARADAGATTVTVTAPATGVDNTKQVYLLAVVGVVATPPSVTITGTGIAAAAVQALTTTTNSWWVAYQLTGLVNGSSVTVNVGTTGKFMSALLVAYPGTGLGAKSAAAAKASSTNQLVLPALVRTNPDSTIVDLWTARDAGTGGLTAVTDGTIRKTERGTGSNNTVVGVSDRSAVTAVTGTFSAASGNGGGIQVEVLPLAGGPVEPVLPTPPYMFVMVGGERVVVEPFVMVGGVRTPVPISV